MRKLLILFLILIPSLIYGGVYFDGVDDVVTITDNASLQVDYITISVWTKVPNIGQGSNKGIIAKRIGGVSVWYVFVNVDNKFGVQMVNEAGEYSVQLNSVDAIVINTWYHLAITYDGTTIKMYVNGVADNTQAFSGALKKTAANLTIGQQYAQGYNLKGTISDVRIYNRALTQSEIKSAMSRCDFADIYTKGIWRFNDNIGYDGKKTFDLSGNNNTGTHTGTSNGNSNPPILMQPIYAGD